MSMSHCIMLSISLNDPSPINPSYTHREIGPPTIHTTTHLHATPDLTKIMFSISLNEPSPMNPSCTPSFIQTQNQNISHHTHCTIIWTPPYPSCIYKQHQVYHRYTWATQLKDAAVSDRGWFWLPSARADGNRNLPQSDTAASSN